MGGQIQQDGCECARAEVLKHDRPADVKENVVNLGRHQEGEDRPRTRAASASRVKDQIHESRSHHKAQNGFRGDLVVVGKVPRPPFAEVEKYVLLDVMKCISQWCKEQTRLEGDSVHDSSGRGLCRPAGRCSATLDAPCTEAEASR